MFYSLYRCRQAGSMVTFSSLILKSISIKDSKKFFKNLNLLPRKLHKLKLSFS